MKLHVTSFGCQMSVADGEEISQPFLTRGFSLTPDIEEADAAIINTCTVRQHAEDRALSLIGRLRPWKENRSDRFLIVAGCAAERLKTTLQTRFPHIDLVVGAKSIEDYPRLLEEALSERFDWISENKDVWAAPLIPDPSALLSPVSAYVTVMRGCNYSCAYCVVPSVRGRELYRPLDTILEETRRKVAAGAKEAMLLGQTVNSYRSGEGRDFADLLRALDALPGLDRIRFMSPHPYYLNARMIAAMAESSKVCRHLHLPLQSGSDRILKRMKRNYTAGEYVDRLERLRQAIPDIVMTTDVIVGFPGESDKDFQETLAVLRQTNPASAYCFKFSARPGTEAARFDDPVPEGAKEAHLENLLALVEGMRQTHMNRWVGRRVQVLLETEWTGRTEHFFNARINRAGRPGELVSGVVTGTAKAGLQVSVSSPLGGDLAKRSNTSRMVPAAHIGGREDQGEGKASCYHPHPSLQGRGR